MRRHAVIRIFGDADLRVKARMVVITTMMSQQRCFRDSRRIFRGKDKNARTKAEHSNKEEERKTEHSNIQDPASVPKRHDYCDLEGCNQAHRELIKQSLSLLAPFELALD